MVLVSPPPHHIFGHTIELNPGPEHFSNVYYIEVILE